MQTLAAITVDVAFIGVVFVAFFFVRPDLHKERVADPFIEFRDPLSHVVSRNCISRTTNMVGVRFKNFFAKSYIALERAQRKRADKIFQQYAHLISDGDENSIEQKQDRRTTDRPSPANLNQAAKADGGCLTASTREEAIAEFKERREQTK